MKDRELQLAAAMMEPESRTVAGITMRPFSWGSQQLCYMLGLSMITERDVAISDAELDRQVLTFAWMQSAPKDDVISAIAKGEAAVEVLKFGMDIPQAAIPEIIALINRIGGMLEASSVRVESKHKSGNEGDAPGKS